MFVGGVKFKLKGKIVELPVFTSFFFLPFFFFFFKFVFYTAEFREAWNCLKEGYSPLHF